MKLSNLQKYYLIILSVLLTLSPPSGLAEEDQESFKILIYGATGKVGSQIVNEALNRGHIVTAVSRNPDKLTLTHERLSVVKGDVLDPESVARLLEGQDVVVVSVRGVLDKSKNPKDSVPYKAVETIVGVLRDTGSMSTRLIHVGGSGSLEVSPGVTYADKLPLSIMPRKLRVEIQGQVLVLDYLRTVSDVNWTYATPAKNFTNGKRTGTFRVAGDELLESESGRSRISRADFAVALIDEVEKAKHTRKRFSVVY